MSRTPSHVFSTATSPIVVVDYLPYEPNKVPQIRRRNDGTERKVIIQGGANTPDKFMRTPRGVATPITADDYDLLVSDPNFNEMMKAGFMSFGDSASDAERAARDMAPKDRSAPKTPDDFTRVDNNTGGRGIRTGRTVEEIARPG